jgi:hypothetical protein
MNEYKSCETCNRFKLVEDTAHVCYTPWAPTLPECEHEFDWDEGYTCLNCGEQGDIGGLIDAAMDREDR